MLAGCELSGGTLLLQGKSLTAGNVVTFTTGIIKFGHPNAHQDADTLFLDHGKRPAPAEGFCAAA